MSTSATNPSSTQAAALANSTAQLDDASLSAGSGWLGWSVFLGMSWTWCIGMFLPVLMVRDYGVAAWFVFAIPNVFGAAAMGWVLRSRSISAQLTTNHRLACQAFSGVTIAFHLFFVVAIISPIAQSIAPKDEAMELALGCVLAASAIQYIYMVHRSDADRTLSWIVLAVSLTAMAFVIFEILNIAADTPAAMPPLPVIPISRDLLFLSPICVFGFMSCPYLDLTFHRARQHSARPRASFGWGFGLFFLTMIVFTLFYARPMINQKWTLWIGIFLFVHMTTQASFTIAAHARELQKNATVAIVMAAVLTVGAWAGYWFLPNHWLVEKLLPGEVIYRAFMGFYGLVFPSYVWLVMLPRSGGMSYPSVRNVTAFVIAVALAAPMFWMGFVGQQMFWLMPGLIIVILARLAVGRVKRVDPRLI